MRLAIAVALAIAAQVSAQKPPESFRARHILIAWKGSAGASARTMRSKQEAKKLADRLWQQLHDGGDFAALAKKYSDDGSRDDGGDLGQFHPGQVPEFFVAWMRESRYGVVQKPKESPFGFHIAERLAVAKPWPDLVRAAHILIAYRGASNAQPDVERSREQAQALATKLMAELSAKKLDFATAVERYSDDPDTRANTGDLGIRRPAALPAIVLADRLCAMKVGDLAGPVESRYGFHILRRDRVELPFRASTILVAWRGAKNAPRGVTRSKAEALVRAKKILKQLADGGDFSRLARTDSDGLSAARGGDLGYFRKGEMAPAFEKAVTACKVGAITGPVESEYGYHIIRRTQ